MNGTSRVLHVSPFVSLGGAGRAVIAAAKYSSRLGNFNHRVVSLAAPDPAACKLAADAGLELMHAPPGTAELISALAKTDILHIHFWNHPILRQFFGGRWTAKTLVWCHTHCVDPPHIMTSDVFDRADAVIVSTEATLGVPIFASGSRRVEHIKAGADFERMTGFEPHSHPTFNVGYVGLFDFIKLHPDFVAMSAAISVPNVRVMAYGEGRDRHALIRQARDLGASGRLTIGPYAADLRLALAQFDVFGYPLCEANTTTAELILQEVMYAGIPPVVLPYGGAATLVIHGETGLIARDPIDYAHQIEYLYKKPAELERLGKNAAAFARQKFGAENTAVRLNALYTELMEWATRPSAPVASVAPAGATLASVGSSGSQMLIASLEAYATDFITSAKEQDPAETLAAERRIAQSGVGMGDAVLSYRIAYPDDPLLRLWSGLVLMHRGRMALAAMEFRASIAAAPYRRRAFEYLEEAARRAGSTVVADRTAAAAANLGHLLRAEAMSRHG
jgi:glycosyltransferase involved in cell wall biosynthesis